ncbi:ATP-binding cassette, subfamily B, bacterial MsbA [Thermotomaculum hydrothermale]|uniref:ATP-binding cassette, subfamily B, bacterial MsbA n=1 Tax=Thermotomaculum hydrothermale TaxID=981385 RepID=A0A7R6SYI3_9BACT|nr:ABC transporter transmembrane domain-containing protein [Thermotomaculum hydrothermale]BBB32680.1 ATP-binding cassette, subfamily B, bacterial MsbA [Thermotomaculum hydrothermale]
MPVVKRFLRYFKPYWGSLILSFIILFFVAVLWEVNTAVAKLIMDGPLKEKTSISKIEKTKTYKKDRLQFVTDFKNKVKKYLEKKGFGKKLNLKNASSGDVAVIVILILILYILKGITTFWGYFLLGVTGHKVIRDLRNDLYSSIINQSVSFFDKYHSGTLISRITNDVYIIQNAVTSKIGDLFKETLFLILIVAAIFYIDYKLSFLLMVIFPLIVVPVILISKAIRKATTLSQMKMAEMMNILKETISGSRIVKAFAMENFEIKKFVNKNYEFFKANVKLVAATVMSSPIMELVGAISLSIVIVYGNMKIKSGEMTTGTFMTYVMNVLLLYSPIRRLNRVNNEMQQAMSALKRVFSLMDEKNKIKSPTKPVKFPEEIKEIEFKNVSFSYDGKKKVLDNINLKAKRGETIAVVGSSGDGKTTLVNLIPRFYDCTDGQITINGIDIREFDLKDLRNNIGIVTQETILFDDTVFNNIAYGRSDIPLEKVEYAAKLAYAHDFIKKMKKGYDTNIGESGLFISGGQRQRLAIARALLKNPPILILDEATSALDTESEVLVQKALENLMKNRTTFVIAHRLSTIRNADRIYVISKGKIVEVGTHEELLKKNGVYKRLYNIQFGAKNE